MSNEKLGQSPESVFLKGVYVVRAPDKEGLLLVHTTLGRTVRISESLYAYLQQEDKKEKEEFFHAVQFLTNEGFLPKQEPAPLVSFVVPALNAQAFIQRCLLSIQTQVFDDDEISYEIIVVDNGSGDDTARIATELHCQVIHEPKKGRAIARNAGIKKAKGQYIAFVDADVELHPTWLSQMVCAFDAPEIGGVQGVIQFKTIPYNTLVAGFRRHESKFNKGCLMFAAHDPFPFLDTAACMYRVQALQEVNGFTESDIRSEDIDLTWKILAAGWSLGYTSAAVAEDYFLNSSLLSYLKRTFEIGKADARLLSRWRTLFNNRGVYKNSSWIWSYTILPCIFSLFSKKRFSRYGMIEFLYLLSHRCAFLYSFWKSKIFPEQSNNLSFASSKNNKLSSNARYCRVDNAVRIICASRMVDWELARESAQAFLKILSGNSGDVSKHEQQFFGQLKKEGIFKH